MDKFIAQLIKYMNLDSSINIIMFEQKYIYQHVLNNFKRLGKEEAYKDIYQIIRRKLFTPIDVKKLTKS